jgi:hypothetical protein
LVVALIGPVGEDEELGVAAIDLGDQRAVKCAIVSGALGKGLPSTSARVWALITTSGSVTVHWGADADGEVVVVDLSYRRRRSRR